MKKNEQVEVALKGDVIVKVIAALVVLGIIGFGAYKLVSATSVDIQPSGATLQQLAAKPDGEVQKILVTVDVYTGKYSPYPAVMKKGVPV